MDVVYATGTTQVGTPDGGRHLVTAGSHWPADDPVVKAAPAGVFSADPRYGMSFSAAPPEMADAPVEAATAAPGERRARVNRG